MTLETREVIGVGGVRITEQEREVAHRQGTLTPPYQHTVDSVMLERDAEYGEAWLLTGQVVNFVGGHRLSRIIESGFMYNWITIMCKLMRVLKSPHHRDSWLDIAGYAQLIVNKIDSMEG